MTNAEYFEKNKTDFTEVMKAFNAQTRTASFDEFLKLEHCDHKFKVGDVIVMQLNAATRDCGWEKNAVFKVIEIDSRDYKIEVLTPPDSDGKYGYTRWLNATFADTNCVLY